MEHMGIISVASTVVTSNSSAATVWYHRIDFLTGLWYAAIWSDTSMPGVVHW